MNYDTQEFETTLAQYRGTLSDADWKAVQNYAEMCCEPSGTKDTSPADDFFCYLSEAIDNL